MNERQRRLLRRIREVPASFLAWKAQDLVKRRAWTLAYRLNATLVGNIFLQDLPIAGTQGADNWAISSDYRRLAGELAGREPKESAELIRRADRSLKGKVPILGFGELSLGRPIDWNRDYVTGHKWPEIAAFRIDFVADGQDCDVKVPWEINRLQFLPWIAQALILTGDQRYSDAIGEFLDEWAAANPPGIGLAWACPMEVAIRAINIRTTLKLCGTILGQRTKALGFNLLRSHAGFLRRHPEKSDVAGNHYLADLSGLIFAGLAISRDHSLQWLLKAVTEFAAEIDRQVDSDGVHIEYATGYHRLVAEMGLYTALELERSGFSVPRLLRDVIERMIDFLATIMNSDGRIPLIGDSDSGQTSILGTHDPNDVRPLLALAALWLERTDLKKMVGVLPADTAWRWGQEAWTDWKNLAASTRTNFTFGTKAFNDSGFAVMRRAQSRVLSRCGKPGLRGRAPHDHCDVTAFVLELNGDSVVVDTGSSTYTGSRSRRVREIEGAAHSVLLIDSVPPAQTTVGSVNQVVAPTCTGLIIHRSNSHRQQPNLTMSHNGFRTMRGVGHYRRELTLPTDCDFRCIDELRGTIHANLQLNLLLAPQWELEVLAGEQAIFSCKFGKKLTLTMESGWTAIKVGTGSYSTLYGRSKVVANVRLETHAKFPVKLAFSINHSSPQNREGSTNDANS